MYQTRQCALLAAAIIILLFVSAAESFSTHKTLRTPAMSKNTLRLTAWSLQMPDNFGTFKSTWYDEVDNPTARKKTYYDDIPGDFRIVAAGSDWPSTTSDTAAAESSFLREESSYQVWRNPLLRARRWISSFLVLD